MCEDEYFDEKRQTYVMDSFEFSSGKVLNNVSVEYMTFGTPKYDGDIITNAIIAPIKMGVALTFSSFMMAIR